MQEPDRKLAWSGLFLGAVIAAEIAWFLFVGPENHSYGAAAASATNGTGDQDYPWWQYSGAWIAIFTIVLTLSTAALWDVTRKALRHAEADSTRQFAQMQTSLTQAGTQAQAALEQARAANEANALVRENFVSTHRPRIILREAFIGSVLEGERIGAIMAFVNIGGTVGRIVGSFVDLEVVNLSVETPIWSGSVESQNEIGEVSLLPGQERLISWDQLDKRDSSMRAPIWEKDKFRLFTKWKNIDGDPSKGLETRQYRKMEIRLVGQILYEDSIGVSRRTAFHRVLIPERQRFYRIEGEPDLDYAD